MDFIVTSDVTHLVGLSLGTTQPFHQPPDYISISLASLGNAPGHLE